MLKTRKLHRKEQDKDKLYGALRELYNDGVRVYTGRLPAAELIKRKVGQRKALEAGGQDTRISLADDPVGGHNPYDHDLF